MIYITSNVLLLPGYPFAAQSWQFDLWSALIGAVLASLLIGLAYYFREDLRFGWEAVTSPVADLSDSLQAGFEDRYRELITNWARSRSLLPHVAPLDEVFVEPQLRCPPSLAQPADQIAAAEPQPLPLHRIFGDHARLAILGPPGSGKTAALAHLALLCAPVADEAAPSSEKPTALQGRMPLYVLLSAMDWSDEEDAEELQEEQDDAGEQESDSVERLLTTAVTSLGGGDRLVKPLRQHLEAGQALVLVDGWDELDHLQQERAAVWLSESMETVPGNVWLIAAGTRGYAPLVDLDVLPLTLSPWDAEQVSVFAQQWTTASAQVGEEPAVTSEVLAKELQQAGGVDLLPLTLTLQAHLYLETGEIPTRHPDLFKRVLDLFLAQEVDEDMPWLPAACRTVLGQLALERQREGYAMITGESLVEAIEAALPPPGERPSRAVSHVRDLLTGERGLLRSRGSDRYVFVHPLWQAYLAARSLVAVDPASLVKRLDDPRWAETLRFYAGLGDMKPLIEALLQMPDDLFHSQLRTLSSWAKAAPKDAPWLEQMMGLLARSILRPDQPAPVRQELAKAMAETGVPGVNYFFKQALQHENPDVRLAAATGLGRSATLSDVPILDMALRDEAPAVRQEAVQSLAYLEGEAATRRLEQVLREGEDTLRALASDALARRKGEDALPLLRDLAESDDVAARRGAIFGLAYLEQKELLAHMVREEGQWIVRSAAEMALEYLKEQEELVGVAAVPEIDQLPWLVSWVAAEGEGMGTGEAAREMLRRALREGEGPVRLAAVQVMAQVGRPDDVEVLRSVLDDPNPNVADAAVEALAEIGRRHDVRIA